MRGAGALVAGLVALGLASCSRAPRVFRHPEPADGGSGDAVQEPEEAPPDCAWVRAHRSDFGWETRSFDNPEESEFRQAATFHMVWELDVPGWAVETYRFLAVEQKPDADEPIVRFDSPCPCVDPDTIHGDEGSGRLVSVGSSMCPCYDLFDEDREETVGCLSDSLDRPPAELGHLPMLLDYYFQAPIGTVLDFTFWLDRRCDEPDWHKRFITTSVPDWL